MSELGKGGCGWHDEAGERERTGGNPWAKLRPMTPLEAAQWVNEQCQKALEEALFGTFNVAEPTAEEKPQRIVTVNVTLSPQPSKEIYPGDEVLINYSISQYHNKIGIVKDYQRYDCVVPVQLQDNSVLYFGKDMLQVVRTADRLAEIEKSQFARDLAAREQATLKTPAKMCSMLLKDIRDHAIFGQKKP